MLNQERNKIIITKSFSFIIENNIHIYPIQIHQLCVILNVELIKLSDIILNTNLTKEDVFKIWGNEDGTLMSYKSDKGVFHHKIAYNDSKSPGRQRFTLLEEFSHIILKHYELESFSIYKQSYTEKEYQYIDEEARICAGFLACPPSYYYSNKSLWCTYICEYSSVLDITPSCAKTRGEIYTKHSGLIKKNKLYSELPKPFVSNFIKYRDLLKILFPENFATLLNNTE